MPLAAAAAIREFSEGRSLAGISVLVLEAIIVISYARARRTWASGAPHSAHGSVDARYEFYGFFGGWAAVGFAALLLGVLGVAHARLAIGVAGVLVTLTCAYAMARGTKSMRRERLQSDPAAGYTTAVQDRNEQIQ
jgi:hypothetical protein